MKVCILMGSPRRNGNTSAILDVFCKRLNEKAINYDIMWLYEKNISPCIGCRACQKNTEEFSCIIRDAMDSIIPKVEQCDVIVLATPIYFWYCTPPMKVVMDRMMFGFTKGRKDKTVHLLKNKKLALIMTYESILNRGSDLFEESVKRCCEYSKIKFIGSYYELSKGKDVKFMDSQREKRAKEFADEIINIIYLDMNKKTPNI